MRPSSFEVMWGVFPHKLLPRLAGVECLTNRCLADMQSLADKQRCERLQMCSLNQDQSEICGTPTGNQTKITKLEPSQLKEVQLETDVDIGKFHSQLEESQV